MIEGADRELFAEVLDQATASSSGEKLDATLAEVGWSDALADDPQTAVSLLFERQGAAGVTSSALDAVLLDAFGVDVGTGAGVAVLMPPVASTAPPLSGSSVASVRGIALASCLRAETVIVGTGERAVALPVESLETRAVTGLDPASGLVEVTGGDVSSGDDLGAADWDAVVAAGQRALAHELVGASRTMLEQARTHALERVQFGRPIAQFQAIRHRLAEALVAVEAADSAAGATWLDGTELTAAAAKAIAGRSARTVAAHAQQVLAGIGFTTEHPLHLFVRRVLVLDGMLGDARSLTRGIGREMLRTRQVPPMLRL